MHTEIIEQKYFKNKDGIACVIDVMPMNTDSWENEIQEGWVAITKKEYQKLIKPSPTKEQQAEQAEAKKQALIAEASQKTQLWQTQLILGIITEEDKASLKEWMLYVQEVQAVDPSPGAGVVWPTPPASPAR